MARITRKELKTDKFALEVEHTVDFFEEHQAELIRYGVAAAVLIVLVVLFVIYRNHQHVVRQEALARAIAIQEAPVTVTPPPNTPVSFPTQQAKETEAVKVLSDLASKYSGSDEGYVAEYYLGCIAADGGKLNDAEKRFASVADSAGKKYASLAKFSLGQVYFAEGKNDLGEKTLREVMDKPTVFVSHDQAALVLARLLEPTKPNEARKLLEPLRAKPGAVGQAAMQAYGDLPSK